MNEAKLYDLEVWHRAAAQRLIVMRRLTWAEVNEKRALAASNGALEVRNITESAA